MGCGLLVTVGLEHLNAWESEDEFVMRYSTLVGL